MLLIKNSSNWKKAVVILFITIFTSYILFTPLKSNAWIILTSLKVIVLDKETNKPIAGAQVEAYNPLYGKESGLTNQDGIWQIPFIGGCGNKYSITISKEGYKQFNHPPITIYCFSNNEVTIKLEKESKNAANPILIIPGIAGTELFYQDEEIWMNTSKMLTDIGDDFLKILSLDNTGNSQNNIITGDIIREKAEIFEIWTDFINDLLTIGYTENQSLFVFPYDWRLDNSYTADLLADKINEIANTTGADKVDIIAHSMGGLITKQYLKTFGEDKVDKLFFLGTPHYGAPKALKTLLFGDNFGIPFILNSKAVKEITGNMSSVYQLLPSSLFFDKYNSYLIDFADADQNGVVGSLSWEQTNNFIKNKNLNFYLNNQAITFHSNIDDWIPSSPLQNRTYNIIGCNRPTLTRLISSTNLKGKTKWQIWLANGDGTVPLKSAEDNNLGERYFVQEAKHSRLPDHPQIRQLILDLLEENTPDITQPLYSQITTTSESCTFNGYLQSIHSPVSVHAYDKSGNHTGPNDQGGIDTEIPGSDYFELGEDKFIYIPEGIEVEFVYQGQKEGGWQLNIQKFSQSKPVKSVNFLKLPTTPEMKAAITISPTTAIENLNLNLDDNGDGEIDNTIAPDTILEGAAAQDITPPQIDIYLPEKNKSYSNDIILDVDYQMVEEESGLSSQILKLDGNEITTKSLDLPMLTLGKHKLEIIAIDKTGNIGKNEVEFSTHTSLQALKNNLKYYWQKKLITANEAYKKIEKILQKIDKTINKYEQKANKKPKAEGKYQNKELSELYKQLNKLLSIINKEQGKTIEETTANLLKEQINFLLSTLK